MPYSTTYYTIPILRIIKYTYINQSNVHCKNGVVVLGLAENDMLHSASGQMVQSRVLSENRYVIFGK